MNYNNGIEGELRAAVGKLKQIHIAFEDRYDRILKRIDGIVYETEDAEKHIVANEKYLELISEKLDKFKESRLDMNNLFYRIFIAWCKYYDFDPETIIKKRMQIDEWNILVGYLVSHGLGYSFLGKKFKKDHSTIINAKNVHNDLMTITVYKKNFFEFKAFMDSILDPEPEEVDLSSLDGQLENQRMFIKKRLKNNVGLTLSHEMIEDLMG